MSALFSTAATTGANPSPYIASADSLFSFIEQNQIEENARKPDFGKFLDAGTGVHSLKWILSLESSSCITAFDAVTADEQMRRNTQDTLNTMKADSVGNIIIGNWADDRTTIPEPDAIIKNSNGYLLPDAKYDTILADYLIGAMDGFSPYYQDLMLPRLGNHLAPGGKIYIVGLQPIPDEVPGPGNVICKVRKVRDACILLANHRCYREYPLTWITRQCTAANMTVTASRQFPILYTHATILRQITVARSKLPLMDGAVRDGMEKVLGELEKESFEATKGATERIKLGFDYVVCCEVKE